MRPYEGRHARRLPQLLTDRAEVRNRATERVQTVHQGRHRSES